MASVSGLHGSTGFRGLTHPVHCGIVGSSVGDSSPAPRQLNCSSQDGTSGASDPAKQRYGCNPTSCYEHVIYSAEPHALYKLDHGTVHFLQHTLQECAVLCDSELLMSITLDRKIATGMIGRAKTGNELLTVLDMIVDSFTKSSKPEPTDQTISF